MNVDQCRALGLIPYAVYGGKVESFKVREHAPQMYSDPVLLKVLDDLLEETETLGAQLKTATEHALETEAALDEIKEAIGWNMPANLEKRDRFTPAHIVKCLEKDYAKVRRELDALKAQIAAGEPFDADEIEAMIESQCETCKLRNGPCVHDEERDLGNAIQDCGLYERDDIIPTVGFEVVKPLERAVKRSCDTCKHESTRVDGACAHKPGGMARGFAADCRENGFHSWEKA